MKKNIVIPAILAIWVIIVLVIASMVETKRDEKLNITTSFYPMYVATLNITDGVEDVEVTNLTKGTTSCLHEYSLTTEEMVSLVDSDALVINGAGMEGFLSNVISNYSNLEIIDSSKGIELIEMECHHNHNHEGEEEEHNSHIFVSVSNYIRQIENITEGLVRIDSKNAEVYLNNSREYIKELEELKKEIENTIKSLPNKNIVTFHESFDYFAHEFGLNVVTKIEKEHGEAASASEIVHIVKEIKEHNVKCIVVEAGYNVNIAATVAKEAGVKIYELNPVTSGKNNKDEYIKIMRENLEVIKEALK
ncbi:MAG: zinc ABC transporter substrate-binding protein [Clostridia bacterium]|nr:zinc ABC transporter substrate-binding protein [Clostridia bacterium]